MRQRHLDRLFARFRGRGDARALAKLFDAVAPELFRLATHLTKDLHAAEDLVQSTFLAAIEGRESWDEGRSVLPWLVGILARQAAYERRKRARVIEPERLEHHEAPEPGRDLETKELSVELSRAIERLPALYREVLLAHLRDGKNAQEMARDLGRAPGTVRVQLHRALELVRKSLPAGLVAGGLLSVVAPRGLAAVRASVLRAAARQAVSVSTAAAATPAAVAIGGGIMSTKAVLGASALALSLAAIGGFAIHELRAPSPVPAVASGAGPNRDTPADRTDLPLEHAMTDPPAERESAGRAAAVPPAPDLPPPHGRRTIEGSAMDVLASPVEGASIEFVPDDAREPRDRARTVSVAEGRFRMEIPDCSGSLACASRPWTGVFLPRIEPSTPPRGLLVVVAPAREISGRVIDQAGAPIPRVELRVELPGSTSLPTARKSRFREFGPDNDIRSTFPLSLDNCRTAQWKVSSDAQGAFRFPSAPRVPGALLVTLPSAYAPDVRTLNPDDAEIVIVLCRPDQLRTPFRGTVTDVRHAPVSQAWVFFDKLHRRTGDDGGFAFDPTELVKGTRLVAVKEGWMPAIQPCLTTSPSRPGAWPDPLVLVLSEEALKIRGQVLDADGTPLPRSRVSAIEPVTLDDMLQRANAEPIQGDLGKGIVLGGREVPTREDGTFELVGLLPGSYRLRVLDVRSLATMDTDPIEAGRSDVRIQLQGGAFYPCVAGQVVDPTGQPVADMRVQARRTSASGTLLAEEVRTDGEGRFKIPSVSREAQGVAVLPERAVPRLFRILDFPDPCSMRLVVPRFGDLRVELGSPGLVADQFTVLDEQGRTIEVAMHWGGGGWQGPFETVPIKDGQSNWVVVPEDAATIVLSRKGDEVSRVAIHVEPGELNLVRM